MRIDDSNGGQPETNNRQSEYQIYRLAKNALMDELRIAGVVQNKIREVSGRIEVERQKLNPDCSIDDEIASMLIATQIVLGNDMQTVLDRLEKERSAGRIGSFDIKTGKAVTMPGNATDINQNAQNHLAVLDEIIGQFCELGMLPQMAAVVKLKAWMKLKSVMNTATPSVKGNIVRLAVLEAGGPAMLRQVIPSERFNGRMDIVETTGKVLKKNRKLLDEMYGMLNEVKLSYQEKQSVRKEMVKSLVLAPQEMELPEKRELLMGVLRRFIKKEEADIDIRMDAVKREIGRIQ